MPKYDYGLFCPGWASFDNGGSRWTDIEILDAGNMMHRP